MKKMKKQSIEDLVFTLMIMLLGEEGKDWIYYETDSDWWTLRLYTRRN